MSGRSGNYGPNSGGQGRSNQGQRVTGRDGGRGRGGRDGGQSGKNRHMGELPPILALLRSPGMSDASILAVVNPPTTNRERVDKLNASASIDDAFKEKSKMLPCHAEWRYVTKIGTILNPESQIVRSNHFRIEERSAKPKIYQYVIHIYRFNRIGEQLSTDCAPDEDSRLTTTLVLQLKDNHPEWGIGHAIGFTYNGRSVVYTSSLLTFASGESSHEEVLLLKNLDGSPSKSKFKVVLTHTDTIMMPNPNAQSWRNVTDERVLNALDSAVLSFARWGIVQDSPTWFTVGSKAFRTTSERTNLSSAYSAQCGYYAGLKSCMAGLVLVSDMSVSCFLNGGRLIDIMWCCGGFKDFEEMHNIAKKGPIPPQRLAKIAEAIKGAKVRLIHLGRYGKVKKLGPPPNSSESSFLLTEKNVRVTVEDYYRDCAKVAGSLYKKALPGGKLKYPSLPCVNLGSDAKPNYVPAELVEVPGGQCRSKVCTPQMTAAMIKIAAVRPETRMRYICAEDSVVNVLRTQQTATSFGIGNIASAPMAVSAFLLPPAKIRYNNNVTVDPKLDGSWNMDGKKFSGPAPGAANIGFGLLVVGGRREPNPYERDIVQTFLTNLTRDAKNAGITLTLMGRPLECAGRNEKIATTLEVMKSARLVVAVMMDDDCYGDIKLVADKMGLPTQCCKFKKVEMMPRGYGQNLMLKINTKLGGINHTLVSRLPTPPTAPVFQQPPASLSWLFDKPCMLVGIDVSHGETSSSMESVAAVVASMDGSCAQYAAHISVQTAGQEIVASLEASMLSLLTTFRSRNSGMMPSCIIVYRDGVGEGQFSQVTGSELSAIRGAVELMGFTEDAVKISIVICQKGHHTRLVYEDSTPGVPMTFINPCPGLCVDASGGANSISSGHLNEFYLNSHVAIQGTAKPCKYTLVHDEIGFKISELELMTYWLTYLYCRANKSVSYASPAYYAHWASKRGKSLCAAGGSPADLLQISQKWGEANRQSPMFFI